MAAVGKEDESRMFRVRKTVVAMLKKRGYNIAADDLNMSPQAFHDEFVDGAGRVDREKIVMRVEKMNNPQDQIFVFFPEGKNIGVGEIKKAAGRMKDKGVHRGILVVQEKMSSFAQKGIADMAPKYLIEHFKENELLVDITEHMLVPVHMLLTDEDKAELLRRYKLREQQLPRIQVNDPVARFYGMQRGQVVKIVRPSETAGRYVTYRYVV